MKIEISTSSLTESNVADLKSINDRMQELTERAEGILKRANEVFPAARAGWLRKLKSALGLLGVHDGPTFEETIHFCERLVSASSDPVPSSTEKVAKKPARSKYTVLFSAEPWRGSLPCSFTEYVWAKTDDEKDAFQQALHAASERWAVENNKDKLMVIQQMQRTKQLGHLADGFVSMTGSGKIKRRRSSKS